MRTPAAPARGRHGSGTRPRWGAIALLGALGALLTPGSRSQDNPIPSPLVEREEVQFISLDLIVETRVRGEWEPYRGLRAEDLLVKLGGRRVELDEFEDRCTASAPQEAAGTLDATAPGASTLRPEPILYILYFDLLHLKLGGSRSSFDAALDWARSAVLPEDRVMIVTGGYGLRIVRPFLPASEGLLDDIRAAAADWSAAVSWAEGEGDRDRGRIGEIASLVGTEAPVRGIPSVRGQESEMARHLANSYAEMDYNNARRSLENLETLMALFDAVDGTKNLILFQETIRLRPGAQYPYAGSGFSRDLSDVDLFLRRLARAANRRNVRIYPVAAGGLETAGTDPALRAETPAAGGLASDQAQQGLADDAMTMLAGETGGRVIERTNALDVAFREVVEDSSCFYRIGFRVPSRHTGDAERIAIQVGDGRGTRLRYRKSVDDPTEEQMEIDLVRGAILDPTSATAFRVTAAAAPLFHYQGGSRVRLQITVPAAELLALRARGDERSSHLQIGGVILSRLPEAERRGRGVMAEVDVRREPWTFAAGAVLKLQAGDAAAGREVAMVREIDAAPGEYWMIATVEDELARAVASSVASFQVPDGPSPLGPVLLVRVDDGVLLVEDRDSEKEKKKRAEEASAPRRHRIRPASPMLPRQLLLSPEGSVAAGSGGRFLYGVCDTFAGDGRQPSFHGWALHRSLRCGDEEFGDRLDGRRIPVPGREAECFVVLENAPPDALHPGECRYEVTLEPPGFRAETRSLPFRVLDPAARSGEIAVPASSSP